MATTAETRPRAAAQTASRYLDELDKRVLIFDGAMGTSILARGLGPDDFGGQRYQGCNDYLALTRDHDHNVARAAGLFVNGKFYDRRVTVL